MGRGRLRAGFRRRVASGARPLGRGRLLSDARRVTRARPALHSSGRLSGVLVTRGGPELRVLAASVRGRCRRHRTQHSTRRPSTSDRRRLASRLLRRRGRQPLRRGGPSLRRAHHPGSAKQVGPPKRLVAWRHGPPQARLDDRASVGATERHLSRDLRRYRFRRPTFPEARRTTCGSGSLLILPERVYRTFAAATRPRSGCCWRPLVSCC